MEPNDRIAKRLVARGVPPDAVSDVVRAAVAAVTAGPGQALEEANVRIRRLGLEQVTLDAETYAMILEAMAVPEPLHMVPLDDRGEELEELLDAVHRARGFDFRGYSERSLVRCLGSRLAARGCTTYSEYAQLLQEDTSEYERLFDALTVTVTSFFRDSGAFKALEAILVSLLEDDPDREIGIWCAGCATGQEAYSVAMLLLRLAERGLTSRPRIRGTDIDADALERARSALYTQADVATLEPVWRDGFFLAEPDGFRVAAEAREIVSFDVHNLASDPPPGKHDIVLCRNVLIYFDQRLQAAAVRRLAQGLVPTGHLLLGRYEMLVGEAHRGFRCVDFDARLYRLRRAADRARAGESESDE